MNPVALRASPSAFCILSRETQRKRLLRKHSSAMKLDAAVVEKENEAIAKVQIISSISAGDQTALLWLAELHGGLELLISTSPLGSRVTLFWASHPPGGRSASQTDELGRAHMSGEPGLKALNVNTSTQPVRHGYACACDTRVFSLSVEIDVASEEQHSERSGCRTIESRRFSTHHWMVMQNLPADRVKDLPKYSSIFWQLQLKSA